MTPEEFIEGYLEHGFLDKAKQKAYNRAYYLRTRKLKGKKPKNSTTRLAEAEEKIVAARQRAKKLSPKKRNIFERKLNAAQKKLNKAKRKAGKRARSAVYDFKDWNQYNEKKRRVAKTAANKSSKARYESVDRQYKALKKDRNKTPAYKMITNPKVYTKMDIRERKIIMRKNEIDRARWRR